MNNIFMQFSTLKIKLLSTLSFIFSFILQISNLQAQPVQAWKFATGSAIHSSAIISGNHVYFGSGDQNVYALNKVSGKLSWKFKTNGEAHSTPTVHQNQLIFSSADGNIYALNKDNGSLTWTFKTKGEQKYDIWDYYLSSPVVYNNTVYIGSGDSSIYAINATTGKLTWSYQTRGIVHATPVLKDGVLYIGSYDGTFYALNSTTGALIWSFKTVGDAFFPKGEIQKAAIIHENTVFFGSRDYNIYALDAKTGTGKWNMKEKGSWVIATPFLYNGNLFFGTSDTHRFYAMTSEFGDVKWTLPLNMRVYGTAALLGNQIVFGCFNGKLYFVNPETGKIESTFQTEESKKRYSTIYDQKDEIREELKAKDYTIVEKEILALGSILSSPLVENNTVYFGDTNGFFYAVNVPGIVK